MKKIEVRYEAAKNLYTGDYEHGEAAAELLIDEYVAAELAWNGYGQPAADSNLASLELLLCQLENLRHRTYLHGSIKSVKIMEDKGND